MSWKEFVVDYLRYSRKERIAVFIILSLTLIVIILPPLITNIERNRYLKTDTAWIAKAKKLEKPAVETEKEQSRESRREYRPMSHGFEKGDPGNAATFSLFEFDPNTLDAAGWKKLGLNDRTVHTIQNYMSKGGHFYKKEDLKKVYGLHADEYAKLEPFIRIEKEERERETERAGQGDHLLPVAIDINTADTSAFITLPGIGAKLAARILSFREKLGGFYSVEQVKETFGLQDSVFQKIKRLLTIESTRIKKININTATMDELKAHPYIRYLLANPIIAYRMEHGPFSTIEDIKRVTAVTNEVYDKIKPYLTIQ